MIPLFPFDAKSYFEPSEGQSEIIEDNLYLNYTLVDKKIISAPSASFGGLYFADAIIKKLCFLKATDLLKKLTNKIADKHREAQTLVLRLAPSVYYDRVQIEFFQAVLEYANFRRYGEVTMILECNQYSPAPALLRNIKKARSNGLIVKSAPVMECFDKLAEIKHAKGYFFGMDREKFYLQVSKFPKYYGCHIATSENGCMEAGLIFLNISYGKLFLAWDQTQIGKNFRATDYIIDKTIALAQREGSRFIDLGTVTDSGLLRGGLVRHKQKFSSIAQVRNTYVCALR